MPNILRRGSPLPWCRPKGGTAYLGVGACEAHEQLKQLGGVQLGALALGCHLAEQKVHLEQAGTCVCRGVGGG